MNDLTANQVEDIWKAYEPMRDMMKRRRNYYEGRHDIVGRDGVYVDGSRKSEVVTNFIAYGVDLYAGSIAGNPYAISAIEQDVSESTPGEEVEANTGPETYRRVGTQNNFDAMDVSNLINALVEGYGVELHEFRDNKVIATSRDPKMWLPIWNSENEFIGLIYRSTVPAGDFYGETLLDNDLEIMVLYTSSRIKTWHKDMGASKKEWVQAEDVQHFYGQVPAVIWRVNEGRKSIITDDIIGQQDEYNDADSSSGDSLRQDTDGVLAIEGYSAKNIADNSETIREYKLLPVPTGGKAYFITKPTDTQRTEARIARTRSHIFMGMKVPDIEEITGSTGSTSGIALRLKFKPMMDNAKYMIANIRQGVRTRIDLINAVVGRMNDTERIENYQVNIDFALPTNRVEEWQNVAALTGIVSPRKQLEVLSDVVDVEEEERRLAKAREDEQFISRTDGTPEEIQARNDAEISALSEALQPQIATVISAISDAAQQETLNRIRQMDAN